MVAFRIEWSDEAQADVRRLDQPTAMRLFDGLLRYALTEVGDVKQLQADLAGKLRLRVGAHRLFFTRSEGVIRVLAVKHRSEAYR